MVRVDVRDREETTTKGNFAAPPLMLKSMASLDFKLHKVNCRLFYMCVDFLNRCLLCSSFVTELMSLLPQPAECWDYICALMTSQLPIFA